MNNKVLTDQNQNVETQNDGGLNRRKALGIIAGAVFGTAALARETLAGEVQLAQEASKDIRTAQQIQKVVLETQVKAASYYEGFITYPKFKEGFAKDFNALDSNSRQYFAYIADVIIATGDKNSRTLGAKLAILAEFLGKNPATAGDVETIKDIVEKYPATKDKFHDLALMNPTIGVIEDSPLGVILLWSARNGGKKGRTLT